MRGQNNKEENLDERLGKDAEVHQVDSLEEKAMEEVKDEERREEGRKKEVEGGEEHGGGHSFNPNVSTLPAFTHVAEGRRTVLGPWPTS